MKSQIIFFVGYMGSGKSSLGKRVAKKMQLPFMDLDKEIEKKFHLSIPEIFAKFGEPTFRQAETEFLLTLKASARTPALIATGGGTPCFQDNMKMMNEIGWTIYLNRSPKELAHRIHNSKKSRPLVDHLPEEELYDFIQEHLKEREVYYKLSKWIVERDEQTVENLVERLKSL